MKSGSWTCAGGIAALFALFVLAADTPAIAAARVVGLTDDNRVGKMLITAGESETIRIDRAFSEIVVGDPEIADVNPLTDKTLYVLGRKLGTTNVTLFDTEKQVVAVIDIEVSHNLSGLREALKQSLPASRLKVRSINGRVLLEGMVSSAPAAVR